MATFNKLVLSGSTDGKMIKVVGTTTGTATTIHTADATDLDEVWLYAVNTSASMATLTIEKGGTAIDDNIVVGLTAQAGQVFVLVGSVLTNSLVVKAFASVANVINIDGWINRITP